MAEIVSLDENGKEVPGTKYKLVAAPRCRSEMLGERCIGVRGHKGLHWHYNQYGDYESWPNQKGLRKFDAAFLITPCGHASYVKPSDRHKETHGAHTKYIKINPIKPLRKKAASG